MTGLTTHVLDAARGRPAVDIAVRLEGADGGVRATGCTDGDGRAILASEPLPQGCYRLVFGTGQYFAAREQDTFYPEVVVTFTVIAAQHYHVPLLLSPYAYSTYRGS